MKTHTLLLALICGSTPLTVIAQDEPLDLFEPTEQPEAPAEQRRQPERMTPQNSAPAFTLRGTARFGDNYSATLVNRDGQTVTLDWKPGTRSQVGSYLGYNVVDVSGRSVSLELPANESCIEVSSKGVSCSANGMALLSLSTAAPLPAREPAQAQPAADGAGEQATFTSADGQPVPAEAVEVLPLNPFSGEPQVAVRISEEERQARAARQEARMRALQNFQPVRIPDDQVPPGMRKVETPFGDRLVPDERQ